MSAMFCISSGRDLSELDLTFLYVIDLFFNLTFSFSNFADIITLQRAFFYTLLSMRTTSSSSLKPLLVRQQHMASGEGAAPLR